jgi:hypothetical protein
MPLHNFLIQLLLECLQALLAEELSRRVRLHIARLLLLRRARRLSRLNRRLHLARRSRLVHRLLTDCRHKVQ